MTETQIMEWMRNKVKKEGFTDAANLANGFLQDHDISDPLDPDFSRTLDAGFKVAMEIDNS